MRSFLHQSLFLTFFTIFASIDASGQNPKVTKMKARAIALKLHPGKVKSGELEIEHGIQIYSFDIQTKEGVREVRIDADSGKVVEDTVESPSDEAKEKAEEKAKKAGVK